MTPLFEQIQEATAAVRTKWRGSPTVGIILGTGLGKLADDIKAEATIPYEAIPYFPRSTSPSHKGQLVCGELAGKTVVAMEGRFHLYEGYTPQEVTFPVRVMKALGCESLIVSNACGGMNPQYRRADIMLIEDHINLLGVNPLTGPNDDRLGDRFPDMCYPYDRELLELAYKVGVEEKLGVQQGVYVAVTGPNLETRAEYRFLRTIGADVVGMSTVPEVIVAVHAKMRVLGLSVVTDLCLPDALRPVSLDEIFAAAHEAEPKLRTLVQRVVARM
ncbi:purine-nucleoside phosphorylase [Fimbriiglobus ruber]|uniref:Purine nucleoside phosphorylase n=1 Tax=Fimbriiglobus ruber TaxID=1908690 RepID=A0A225DQ12_9BACT|nr:purine-nucleoside phosphorylase [Fimbriiglobus ruber]OWK43452.1 Purine nucleoside phosphorylase [Fimbriiglobus ruber]